MGQGKFLEPFVKGIAFGVSPLRWLPVFILDLAFFSLLIGLIAGDGSLAAALLGMLVTQGAVFWSGSLVAALLVGVAWFLARLWVTGSVIHQAHRERDFHRSWKESWERFPSLLGAMVVVIVAGVLLGTIPVFGQLLSILTGVATFFSLQAVMVRKRSAMDSIRDSFSIWWKRMGKVSASDPRFLGWVAMATALAFFAFLLRALMGSSPLVILALVSFWFTAAVLAFLLFFSPVFRIWLLVSLVSGAVVILFAIPVLLLGLSLASPDLLLLGGNSPLAGVILSYLSNPPALLLAGTIFLIGSSIATAFALKVQTEFYLQFRRHLWPR